MKVRIKRIDPTLPLPKYETEGAVAFDLYSREKIEIEPHTVYRIPTNLIIEIPAGYMLFVRDRSSTAVRKHLLPTAGIIDQDYCGPEDEILFQVYNIGSESVVVDRGERVGQAILIPIERAEWEEVEGDLKNESRGGFGSTG